MEGFHETTATTLQRKSKETLDTVPCDAVFEACSLAPDKSSKLPRESARDVETAANLPAAAATKDSQITTKNLDTDLTGSLQAVSHKDSKIPADDLPTAGKHVSMTVETSSRSVESQLTTEKLQNRNLSAQDSLKLSRDSAEVIDNIISEDSCIAYASIPLGLKDGNNSTKDSSCKGSEAVYKDSPLNFKANVNTMAFIQTTLASSEDVPSARLQESSRVTTETKTGPKATQAIPVVSDQVNMEHGNLSRCLEDVQNSDDVRLCGTLGKNKEIVENSSSRGLVGQEPVLCRTKEPNQIASGQVSSTRGKNVSSDSTRATVSALGNDSALTSFGALAGAVALGGIGVIGKEADMPAMLKSSLPKAVNDTKSSTKSQQALGSPTVNMLNALLSPVSVDTSVVKNSVEFNDLSSASASRPSVPSLAAVICAAAQQNVVNSPASLESAALGSDMVCVSSTGQQQCVEVELKNSKDVINAVKILNTDGQAASQSDVGSVKTAAVSDYNVSTIAPQSSSALVTEARELDVSSNLALSGSVPVVAVVPVGVPVVTNATEVAQCSCKGFVTVSKEVTMNASTKSAIEHNITDSRQSLPNNSLSMPSAKPAISTCVLPESASTQKSHVEVVTEATNASEVVGSWKVVPSSSLANLPVVTKDARSCLPLHNGEISTNVTFCTKASLGIPADCVHVSASSISAKISLVSESLRSAGLEPVFYDKTSFVTSADTVLNQNVKSSEKDCKVRKPGLGDGLEWQSTVPSVAIGSSSAFPEVSGVVDGCYTSSSQKTSSDVLQTDCVVAKSKKS